jgi:hypothetical protein
VRTTTNSRRIVLYMVLMIIFVMTGCSNVSEDFRRDAAYTYNLLNAAENGSSIQKSQVEEGLAKTKADARNETEREVVQTLEHYRSALNPTYDSPVSRRFLDVCRWEAAHEVGQPEPSLSKSASIGDCERLWNLEVDRDTDFTLCMADDEQLISIDERMNKANSNPSLWLRLYNEQKKLQAEVEKICSDKADAKVQPAL